MSARFPVFDLFGTPPVLVLGWGEIDLDADLIAVDAPNGKSRTTQIGGARVPALARQLLVECMREESSAADRRG